MLEDPVHTHTILYTHVHTHMQMLQTKAISRNQACKNSVYRLCDYHK